MTTIPISALRASFVIVAPCQRLLSVNPAAAMGPAENMASPIQTIFRPRWRADRVRDDRADHDSDG